MSSNDFFRVGPSIKPCVCSKEREKVLTFLRSDEPIVPDKYDSIVYNFSQNARESGEPYAVVRHYYGDIPMCEILNLKANYGLHSPENNIKRLLVKGFKDVTSIDDDFLRCVDLSHVDKIELSSLSNIEHISDRFLDRLRSIDKIDLTHMTKLKTIGKFVIRK